MFRQIHSEETKKKISKALKLAHQEGRHPGWNFINSNKDRMSYPEIFIQKVLKNNNIYNKYKVREHFPMGKYFLDFVILDIKLDIEVDGCQHYRNESQISHDNIRNNFLISKGWKIYRINWKRFCKNTKLSISSLLDFIVNIDKNTSYFYKITDFTKKSRKYGKRKDFVNAIKYKYEKEQQKYIPLILHSTIDFSKFGWVSKVAPIINQKVGKVNIWMKRFMYKFYMEKCFKRKT